MSTPSHPQIYDQIGVGYQCRRIPDSRIEARIRLALGDSLSVCNVGAGAGSYEPSDLEVTAVEPSQAMISQRSNAFPVVQATAEELPFPDKSFDAAMAVLTVHHWLDPARGLQEMKRISRRQVIFTFDPNMMDALWLVKDYFPEIIEFERDRGVPISLISEILKPQDVQKILVPSDCTDGFQSAYWQRPEMYLRRKVRDAISTFQQLPSSIVERGVQRLADDIESGAWHRKYSELTGVSEMDFGYRLIISHDEST